MEQIFRLDTHTAKRILEFSSHEDLGKQIYNLLSEYVDKEDPQLSIYLVNSINKNKKALLHCLKVQHYDHQSLLDKELFTIKADTLFSDAMAEYEISQKHLQDFTTICDRIRQKLPDEIDQIEYDFTLGSRSFELANEQDDLKVLLSELFSFDDAFINEITNFDSIFDEEKYESVLLKLTVDSTDSLYLEFFAYSSTNDQGNNIPIRGRSLEEYCLPIFLQSTGYKSVFEMWNAEQMFIQENDTDKSELTHDEKELLEQTMNDYRNILNYYSLLQPKSIQNFNILLYDLEYLPGESTELQYLLTTMRGFGYDDLDYLDSLFTDASLLASFSRIKLSVLGYRDGIISILVERKDRSGKNVVEGMVLSQNQSVLLNVLEWSGASDMYELFGEDRKYIETKLRNPDM